MKPGAVAVALTGASGIPYGMRLLECLVAAGETVWVMVSEAARVVAGLETDYDLPGRNADLERWFRQRLGAAEGQVSLFGTQQWTAPPASGSNPPRAMVVCPCTMGTLAAIAQGTSDNLVERAADVVLKEGRELILVPRETPLSAIHLENMLRLARAGAVIMPACPGFYHRPEEVGDLVDFMVARILDRLGIEHDLMPPWGEEQGVRT